MANHKSSIKRIRQIEKRRLHNKFYAKVTRNAVRKLRAMSDKNEAVAFLPKVSAMVFHAEHTRDLYIQLIRLYLQLLHFPRVALLHP